MKKIIWTETDFDIFETCIKHKGIDYRVCVESDNKHWQYTIDSENIDFPFCSTENYIFKEDAQKAAIREIKNV